MSFEITVEVTMTVRDNAEAEKIFDAAASGLAEVAIKDRVLYGGVAPVSVQPSSTSSVKSQEALKKLTPIETKSPKSVAVEPVAPKPERSRGVMGRRQMHRTGGN